MPTQSAPALSAADNNALPIELGSTHTYPNLVEGGLNQEAIAWHDIDTVILDMDGTILDLHFDNRVWNELVPERFAQRRGSSVESARNELLNEMARKRGTIEYYSFDYWDAYTGLCLVDIHAEVTELVAYRPGALDFLKWLRASGRHSIIATNAHRSSLLVKSMVIDLAGDVDDIISSHDYGVPKEDQAFWRALQAATGYDANRSLFVDDNEPVIAAAVEAGIAHVRAIATPDSTRPTRYDLSYPCFDDFHDIFESAD